MLFVQDLGYFNRNPCCGSSFGAAEPFPLLSSAACDRIKTELDFEGSDLSPSFSLFRDLLCWFMSDKFENLINRIIDVSHAPPARPPSPTDSSPTGSCLLEAQGVDAVRHAPAPLWQLVGEPALQAARCRLLRRHQPVRLPRRLRGRGSRPPHRQQ